MSGTGRDLSRVFPLLPAVLNLTCFTMRRLMSNINPAVLIYGVLAAAAAAEGLAVPDVKLALQVSRRYKSPAVTAHILKITHRRSWRRET